MTSAFQPNAPIKTDTAIRHGAEKIAALFPALMVEAQRLSQTIVAGAHGRRQAGPGETFWQHRPYGFGDPVGSIDWRQSARASDRLYVRQNEWEAAAAVWIWRDPSTSLQYASSKATPQKRNRADVLATACALLMAEAGERFGLLGDNARLFHGRSAPNRLLEILCQDYSDKALKTQDSAPPVQLVRAGANILLISDFFTDITAIEKACTHYADLGASGVLLQVLDPAEEDFPFSGRTEFEDIETRDRLTFGDTGALGREYRRVFAAHRTSLQTIARKTGWRFISHRTDRPAQTALLSVYAALSDHKGGHTASISGPSI